MAGRWGLLLAVAGLAASLRPQCPVQLVNVEDESGSFKLVEEGLRYLEHQHSPLFLVPVLGVYRGGKSFLLNRCMGLQAPYSNGFGVGHSQDTHTRGIYVCAENVEGLGTVVWMDTEGLFSNEHARSSYGPKMFSLAMLFSSTVLLNSVKVLNDQFFTFFSDQQQLTRVLRHGLISEGLPEGALLPKNHSLIWVVQQPVGLDEKADGQLHSQLQSFLKIPGDEARERVHRDFSHHLHMVPAASRDVRLWGTLDKTPEEELVPAFQSSVVTLRKMVLDLLQYARPMEADGVARQMKMFAELVETEQFNGKLAREAIEEGELSTHCGAFGRTLAAFSKNLPMNHLPTTLQQARSQHESVAFEAAENFHFTQSWKTRLNLCLDSRTADITRRNEERLLEVWEEKASSIAEGSSCFFLDRLVSLRDELEKAHSCTLSADLLSRSLVFATGLQRARLVECLKLKHVLLPFLPWIVWPITSFYIRAGVFSGLWQLGVHAFLVVGAYTLLRICQQLPPYMDIEYPVLQARPQLLDAMMQVIPWMPWATLANVFIILGALCSGLKLVRAVADRCRPAGNQIGGMVNLELKLNVLLKRSEVLMQQGLMATLHETTAYVGQRDASSAQIALMRGLCMLRGANGEDPQVGAMADFAMRHRISRLLEDCQNLEPSGDFCNAWTSRDILGTALQGDWASAVEMMAEVLENCQGSAGRHGRFPPASPATAKVRTASPAATAGVRRRVILGGS